MAKSIEYPSADFPGPPRITVDVPDDWETLTVPGVQVAVAQPRVEGTFRANVVVTVQRFGPEFTLEEARAVPGATIFSAGVSTDDEGRLVTAGGRVLAVTGEGSDLAAARETAHRAVSELHWPGMHHRSDIGASAT